MLRVIKAEGFGNIQLEEVPIPQVSGREVLVRNHVTLISRGSELFARYNQEGPVEPRRMGYSAAGVVAAVGDQVTELHVGDRVMAVAPHAEYVVGNPDAEVGGGFVGALPEDLSFEQGAFLPLCTSAVEWAASVSVPPEATVVILGMGLVGNLTMQAWREHKPGRLVAVDLLPLRCRLADELGADVVINASNEDPVAAVRRLTNGRGAEVVVDCVGGNAGIRSFEQAQEMLAREGTLHLIALYHGGPLPLHAQRIMDRKVIAGRHGTSRREAFCKAIRHLQTGQIRVEPLITHRFPGRQAPEAFHFLWHHPDEAMGVLFEWVS